LCGKQCRSSVRGATRPASAEQCSGNKRTGSCQKLPTRKSQARGTARYATNRVCRLLTVVGHNGGVQTGAVFLLSGYSTVHGIEGPRVPTETEHPSSAGAETLSELAARHGRQLKSLRGAGTDPHAIIAAANAAADEIELRVDAAAPALTETERAALLAVQAMTFNAAADCWPGWEIAAAKELRPSLDLRGGLDLARRSSVLVHRLHLGALREGTAHWMVGAYELALGRTDEAVYSFSLAVARYDAAGAPGMAWLARGYIAITYEAAHRPRADGVASFQEVLSAIEAGDLEDAASLRDQLNTARRVFTTIRSTT
jgi:hypothetical protein